MGFVGAVIIGQWGTILAGPARRAAAERAGLEEIPTLGVRVQP